MLKTPLRAIHKVGDVKQVVSTREFHTFKREKNSDIIPYFRILKAILTAQNLTKHGKGKTET